MSSFAELFGPPAEPPTKLGYRRLLSPSCGLRVSPFCLGGMSLGDKWSGLLGAITKEEAFKLLDAFYEAGGNFIDTACNYHYGQSEEWIGEWMELRGNRDKIVLATKYSSFTDGDVKDANSSGNHGKSLTLSVRNSLKRLRTDYLDILYVHVWDWTTSVEEVMRFMHKFVLNGQILYPAVSDTPAWLVVKANAFARSNGLSPFILYQGKWNLGFRDLERDIVPMCRDQGMGIAPWGSIGGGMFMSKAQAEARVKQGENLRGGVSADKRSESDIKISEGLEKVANEIGANVTSVALAWVMQRTAYVFPIIGGRKVEHLHDNIKALSINLTQAQLAELDKVAPFDLGFPYNMIGTDPHWTEDAGHNVITSPTARHDFVQTYVPLGSSKAADH